MKHKNKEWVMRMDFRPWDKNSHVKIQPLLTDVKYAYKIGTWGYWVGLQRTPGMLWKCSFPRGSEVVVQLLSHGRLFATPWTAACQAPLSVGFSRQEYWSGLPFPPPSGVLLLIFCQPQVNKSWVFPNCEGHTIKPIITERLEGQLGLID